MNASPLQPNTTHGRATLLHRHDANKWLCRCACGEVYTRNRGVLLLEARDGTAACPKCRASIPKKERPRVPKALRQANLAMTCDMCRGYRHHMHMEASGRCVFDLVEEHGELSLEDIGQHLDLTKEMVRKIGVRALKKLARLCHRRGITLQDVLPASPEGWFDE